MAARRRGRGGRAPRAASPTRPLRGAPGNRYLAAVGALALAGLGVSVYLSAVHFSGGEAFCPEASGCDQVLASTYARLLGIPVALIGALGYAAIAAMALAAWRMPTLAWVYPALVLAVLAGFSFSAYLTGTQLMAIGSYCYYCLGSAAIITATLAVALAGWRRSLGRSFRPLLMPGGAVAAVVVLGALALPTDFGGPSGATDYRTALAHHLTDSGVVMYGAYWCPHCQNQKDAFGDAFRHVTYVECAADGRNANPFLCAQKGIESYPTWEINGVMHRGEQPLSALARLTGFSFEGSPSP